MLDEDPDEIHTHTILFEDTEDDTVEYEILTHPVMGMANITGDVLSYMPDKHFTGYDQVTVKMTETGLPELIKPFVVSETLHIVVNPVNDPPQVHFFGTRNETMNSVGGKTTGEVIIDGKGNSSIVGTVGMYDFDENQNLTLLISWSSNDTELIRNDSSGNPEMVWSKLQPTYNGTIEAVDLEIEYPYHHGEKISLGLVIVDQDNSYSYPLIIDVYVLKNPCIHGNCTGPSNDPNCTSRDRGLSFDGYTCTCEKVMLCICTEVTFCFTLVLN